MHTSTETDVETVVVVVVVAVAAAAVAAAAAAAAVVTATCDLRVLNNQSRAPASLGAVHWMLTGLRGPLVQMYMLSKCFFENAP